MTSLVSSFIRRLKAGDAKNALYLTYYYSYLKLYDRRHRTRFAVSHAPSQSGADTIGGTGNFPAHPVLVRRFLSEAGIARTSRIIDIGHGSGIALYVASEMGYEELTGIEFAEEPYALSVSNLDGRAQLLRGDALTVDLSDFDAVLFFNPFGGERARQLFTGVGDRVATVIAINADPVVGVTLGAQGFEPTYEYRHRIYGNFNARIWKRDG